MGRKAWRPKQSRLLPYFSLGAKRNGVNVLRKRCGGSDAVIKLCVQRSSTAVVIQERFRPGVCSERDTLLAKAEGPYWQTPGAETRAPASPKGTHVTLAAAALPS